MILFVDFRKLKLDLPAPLERVLANHETGVVVGASVIANVVVVVGAGVEVVVVVGVVVVVVVGVGV
eukprot:CAMPEP_0174270370 /NCGR_PEP_ID=MMETSP0439-20130205/44192_1 /TAXON_ID=0 /ORGANISM="Stereomyxa ramosa, Strain Chinc5" /LENGTH=65 /DNA_ID=CAMNT_0015359665 /DNA_START=38 /DNA_END=232 /DNA_ORIENTATION=-